MQMISLIFFAFLGVLLAVLALEDRLPDRRRVPVQKLTLLFASFVFLGYANLWFLLIFAVQALITWYCAKNKKYVKFGVIALVALLGVFKYTNFFTRSFALLVGAEEMIFLKIILPLGISFYTFSAISYLVDVKREKIQARSFPDVALYLSFFPKLTSGPIQRSEDFFREMNRPRSVNLHCISAGVQIFAFGMFKKLVLADNLSVFVNQVYGAPQAFSSATVLWAVISYSLQIYFDFSGYSDMAIGVAKMMNVNLPRNFNLPYLSHNVTELWKRWHITLSSWLQEYLYFPLGGNRKGIVRTYVNLILTMVIGGIWHGANWTYIVWGLLHGVGLAVHKLWTRLTGSREKAHSLLANVCAILVTFAFTSFCWIFFRAESISDAFTVIGQIFRFADGVHQPYLWTFVGLAVLILSSVTAAVKSRDRKEKFPGNQSYVNGFYPLVSLDSFWGLVVFFVFLGLILALAYTGGSPFIYGAY